MVQKQGCQYLARSAYIISVLSASNKSIQKKTRYNGSLFSCSKCRSADQVGAFLPLTGSDVKLFVHIDSNSICIHFSNDKINRVRHICSAPTYDSIAKSLKCFRDSPKNVELNINNNICVCLTFQIGGIRYPNFPASSSSLWL